MPVELGRHSITRTPERGERGHAEPSAPAVERGRGRLVGGASPRRVNWRLVYQCGLALLALLALLGLISGSLWRAAVPSLLLVGLVWLSRFGDGV